jgi:hypothetical protein
LKDLRSGMMCWFVDDNELVRTRALNVTLEDFFYMSLRCNGVGNNRR